MTRSQALAALRRAAVPAISAVALTFVAVVLLVASRPDEYVARVGLVATPVASSGENAPEYGSVVSLAMPAIPQLAVSTPVLAEVSRSVPGMTRSALESSVAVEIVPASGVAQISVTAERPQVARAIVDAVVQEVQRNDILAPVAELRLLGDVMEDPRPTAPDPLLGTGLAILAAAVVGVLAVAAMQVLRPVLLTTSDVERLVRSETGERFLLVEDRSARSDPDLLLSRVLRAAPAVRDVAVLDGEADAGLVADLRARLRAATPQDRGGPAGAPLAALIPVRLRRTRPQHLRESLWRADAEGCPVGVVVVR